MKRILISAVLLVWTGAGLWAQNLDPTVVVTNTYAREASGIEKPSQLMDMPDSVLRFNLDFDYSVRNTPYMGAYEFKPYMVELRPTARPTREGRFYLSGGAGYTLHPELTVIWTPIRRDRFRMNLYADHHSYWGPYRNIALQDGWFGPDGTRYTGTDMHTVAGLNGLLTWNGGSLVADLRYRHVLGTDALVQKASFNAVDFHARVQSDPEASLLYEVETTDTGFWSPFVEEIHSLTKAGIGTHFGMNYLSLGASVELISRKQAYVGNLAFTPRYLLTPGDFRIELGAKVSFLFRSAADFYPLNQFVFPLFPDVHVTYYLLPDVVALQASATGGHVMNVYSSMVDENPFLAGFSNLDGTPLSLDASVEHLNAMLGARGNIAERFHYDLKVGFAFRSNAQLWGFTEAGAPALGYAKYNLFYTDLALGWKADYLDVDAHLLYCKPWLEEDRLFAPAAFSGNVRAVYNWGDRIKAGVTVQGQTERTARLGSLPGYVDLGLLGDLQMTRVLGFWLRVGNLLNQPVQRVPFHAENGIYVTVGARLNF